MLRKASTAAFKLLTALLLAFGVLETSSAEAGGSYGDDHYAQWRGGAIYGPRGGVAWRGGYRGGGVAWRGGGWGGRCGRVESGVLRRPRYRMSCGGSARRTCR